LVAILVHEDRAAFKRCRRAWDLGARERRHLEAIATVEPIDPDRLLRDALAVYYFPGMWDWSRGVVLPLVDQALTKSLAGQVARLGPDPPPHLDDVAEAALQLLHAYTEWAPRTDRFGPVLVEVDFDAGVMDPDHPDLGFFIPSGQHLRYQGRVDLLAVDQHDAYWIVRHRVVKEWTPLDALIRDEEAVAACWAWEQFYIGMEIAGTIHTEMRMPTRPAAGEADVRSPVNGEGTRGGVRQHEGSGGGRSIPDHRRMYAKASEPILPERIEHDVGSLFRRTWVRRTRPEVAQAGHQLSTEAREIFAPDVAVYPSPSEANCRRCPFAAPCLAHYEGRDAEAEAILQSSYRSRPEPELQEGRLGGVTWSTGRGAAPPKFSDTGR
jgi:hypothetical protein